MPSFSGRPRRPTFLQSTWVVGSKRLCSCPTMGHRRFALLGLAVAILFAVDGAAAASKGAPRAGGQRRTSKTAGSRPSRSQRDAEDDQDFQNWNGDPRKGERRSGSRPSRGAHSSGSGSSRVRPSSHGSSRSRSRFVFASDAWQHTKCTAVACHPHTTQVVLINQ